MTQAPTPPADTVRELVRSLLADGTPGPAMHNRYVTLYHRGAHRYSVTAPRPLARFNRSGWTGAAQSSSIPASRSRG